VYIFFNEFFNMNILGSEIPQLSASATNFGAKPAELGGQKIYQAENRWGKRD